MAERRAGPGHAASAANGIGVPLGDGGTSHATALAIPLRRCRRLVRSARGVDGRLPIIARLRTRHTMVRGRRAHHRRGRTPSCRRPGSHLCSSLARRSVNGRRRGSRWPGSIAGSVRGDPYPRRSATRILQVTWRSLATEEPSHCAGDDDIKRAGTPWPAHASGCRSRSTEAWMSSSSRTLAARSRCPEHAARVGAPPRPPERGTGPHRHPPGQPGAPAPCGPPSNASPTSPRAWAPTCLRRSTPDGPAATSPARPAQTAGMSEHRTSRSPPIYPSRMTTPMSEEDHMNAIHTISGPATSGAVGLPPMTWAAVTAPTTAAPARDDLRSQHVPRHHR